MSESIPVTVGVTAENKCGFCSASICCTYVTQKITGPRSKYDFDHLLWQISHQGVHIYKDSDGWYLQVHNVCTHLQADGGCGIYETRPQICRDHSNDFCEYDEPASKNMELYFDSYDSLLKYCRKRFKSWGP